MFDYQECDRPATMQESVYEWARNVGYEERYINRQWLLHDYDVWVRNPHYVGPPQPYPEDYDYES